MYSELLDQLEQEFLLASDNVTARKNCKRILQTFFQNYVEITKATVIWQQHGTDLIRIHTTLPCPYPPEHMPTQPPLILSFHTSVDDGVEYCRKHFGIEPKVIDARDDQPD